MIFEGSAAAVVTPMAENGAIDFEAMGKLLEFQLENGTDAIVVNGTTGESSTLQDEEKYKLIEFTVKRVHGRVPVIAGAGSNNTAHAVELSKKAQELGADGLLEVTPYYNKTSVSIPVILYHVPSRTGMTMEPETCKVLSQHPNIQAVKEAGGNISHVARIASLCGEDLDIYSGNDDQTVPVLSLGGKGVISVLANIMPRETHEMCRLFLNGQEKESLKLQLDLLDLMNALFLDVNPVPVKTALSLMGMCEENYRLPLIRMSAADKAKLTETMKRHSLI